MAMKIEGKEYDFTRVLVRDALKIKGAMQIAADENASLIEKENAEDILNTIAIDHLRIKVNNEWVEKVTLEYLDVVFENPFAVVEILASFNKQISGFMQSLPSFQTAKASNK